MSYIEPSTDIYLLECVPLEPNYEHTIYFPISISGSPERMDRTNYARATYNDIKTSRDAQAKYFTDHYTHYRFTRNTYQRVNKNTLRVHKGAESLLKVNYMIFKNTNFQDTGEHTANEKWFFAFVLKVDYINNEVSEITYQIDVMQTWWYDHVPNPTYVEREHSQTDYLWENLVEENLTLGDDYVTNFQSVMDMNQMYLIILVNRKAQSISGTIPATTSMYINNVVTPVKVFSVLIDNTNPITSIQQIDAILDDFLENEILCVFQFPAAFGNPTTTAAASILTQVRANIANIDGHTVRNKKLFSYPYNFLHVSNNCGQSADYKYENWSDIYSISESSQLATFDVIGCAIPNPSIICYPKAYKKISDAFDEGLMYPSIPVTAWSGDTFKNWWVQNKGSFVTSNISSVISALSSGLSAAMTVNIPATAQSVISLADKALQSAGRLRDIDSMANQTHGNVQTDALNAALGRIRYDFYCYSIKRQFAEIIDDYFDRFGYACKKVKEPNRLARSEWSFVKTLGCTLYNGRLPGDAEKELCDIYDKGVTFWVNPAHVGDYSLSNPPLGIS